jgi:hypothetical protein
MEITTGVCRKGETDEGIKEERREKILKTRGNEGSWVVREE